MKALHVIAFILVIVGGLNWGLVGVNEGWNLVDLLLGNWPAAERAVYVLVGLSALYLLFTHKKACRDCVAASSNPTV